MKTTDCRTKPSFLFSTLAITVSFITLNCLSVRAETEAKTDSLKQTLVSGGRSAEVFIEPGKAEVKLQRGNDLNPSTIELTVYNEKKQPTTFVLAAISPLNGPVSTYSGTFSKKDGPVLSGSMTPIRESFMGIELRISLPTGKSEIFKAKPNPKSER